MEERSSFGEKVQARIRYTCSTVASQIEQYLDTFPMQSRTRGNMISRMRKRTGIEDNYEALKGMDELHMMTLRHIPKRLMFLYSILYDIFQKNWDNLINPDSLRQQYETMICCSPSPHIFSLYIFQFKLKNWNVSSTLHAHKS